MQPLSISTNLSSNLGKQLINPYESHLVRSWSVYQMVVDKGTNSNAVLSSKAFTSDVISHFRTTGCKQSLGVDDCNATLHCYPDIVCIPDHMDGLTAAHLFDKLLTRLGMETWASKLRSFFGKPAETARAASVPPLDETDGPTPSELRQQGLNNLLEHQGGRMVHLSTYIFGTDKGPDMQGAITRLFANTACHPCVLMFWTWCVMHQLHLIVKRQLGRFPNYWSSVAKSSNTWRASGHAKRLHRTWKKEYPLDADRVASTILPQPVQGRWGVVTLVENFFLRCGFFQTAAVFRLALGKLGESLRSTSTSGSDMTDDPNGESYPAGFAKP